VIWWPRKRPPPPEGKAKAALKVTVVVVVAEEVESKRKAVKEKRLVCLVTAAIMFNTSIWYVILRLKHNFRRLLSSNDASSEFNSWCDQELHKFNTDVDSELMEGFEGAYECVKPFYVVFVLRQEVF